MLATVIVLLCLARLAIAYRKYTLVDSADSGLAYPNASVVMIDDVNESYNLGYFYTFMTISVVTILWWSFIACVVSAGIWVYSIKFVIPLAWPRLLRRYHDSGHTWVELNDLSRSA